MQIWLSVIVGGIIVLFIVRDVLLTLLAPSRRSMLSQLISRFVWRLLRPVVRRHQRMRELTGALVVLTVLGIWTTLAILGWALIYWPFLPESFLVDFGLEVERGSAGSFITAIYFSTVVIVTLGFGDIVPTTTALRIIVPIQGLVGIGLLTGGIGWFLSINPALGRRRALAHQISLLRSADRTTTGNWNPGVVSPHIASFANQISVIRSDVLQFPITYYFRDADPASDLLANLPYLLFLSNRDSNAQADSYPEFELNRQLLNQAITDYLQTLMTKFHDPTLAANVEELHRLLSEKS